MGEVLSTLSFNKDIQFGEDYDKKLTGPSFTHFGLILIGIHPWVLATFQSFMSSPGFPVPTLASVGCMAASCLISINMLLILVGAPTKIYTRKVGWKPFIPFALSFGVGYLAWGLMVYQDE